LGLGLFITRSIIETHGGRLWATANLPRAIFEFTVPACEDIRSGLDHSIAIFGSVNAPALADCIQSRSDKVGRLDFTRAPAQFPNLSGSHLFLLLVRKRLAFIAPNRNSCV